MTASAVSTAAPKERRSLWWLYVLLALPVLGVTWFVVWRPITVLPRITLGPGYAFQDQTGALQTSEDRRGQLTLYSFSYEDCAAPCPQSLESLAELNAALPAELDLVTINLASERPAVTPAWPFLTGEEIFVKKVVGSGFDMYYRPEANGQIYFEPRFVLVDKLGLIRAYYLTNEPDLELIRRDVTFLLEEEQNSQGVGAIGYEAAHLFLCYPR